MKRNMIGLFLLASMFVASVKAEEVSATAPVTPPAVTVTTDAKTTGMLSSVLAQVMKPANWTKENVWDAYPRASASAATFVALWAACRMYKPLGQTLFGCQAHKTTVKERAEYSRF